MSTCVVSYQKDLFPTFRYRTQREIRISLKPCAPTAYTIPLISIREKLDLRTRVYYGNPREIHGASYVEMLKKPFCIWRFVRDKRIKISNALHTFVTIYARTVRVHAVTRVIGYPYNMWIRIVVFSSVPFCVLPIDSFSRLSSVIRFPVIGVYASPYVLRLFWIWLHHGDRFIILLHPVQRRGQRNVHVFRRKKKHIHLLRDVLRIGKEMRSEKNGYFEYPQQGNWYYGRICNQRICWEA